jgi:hypothetical protein
MERTADYLRYIKTSLTDDLLKKKFKGSRPLAGHCYVASEAAFHLFARVKGYSPCFIRHEGQPHWFLICGSKVIDITACQFYTKVPYERGRRIGFLTKRPSRRARTVIRRVKKLIQNESNRT